MKKNWRDVDYDKMADVRKSLKEMFKLFRSEGFLARMNFSCCTGCAGYELATIAEERIDNGKEVLGCMFWTHQDQEDWNAYGELYIAYGGIKTEKHGEVGFSSKQVGERIVMELKRRNIPHEWDGDPDKKIFVMAVDMELEKKKEEMAIEKEEMTESVIF